MGGRSATKGILFMKKKIFWAVFAPYIILLLCLFASFFYLKNSFALGLTKAALRESFSVFYSESIYQIENYENYENRIKKLVASYKTGLMFYPWLIRSNGEEVAVPDYKAENDPGELRSNTSLFRSYIISNQPSGTIFRDSGSTYKYVEYKALGQTDLIVAMVADVPKSSMPAAEVALSSITFMILLILGVFTAWLVSNNLAAPFGKLIAYAAMLFNESGPEEPPEFKDGDINGLAFFLKGIDSRKVVYVDQDRNPITHMHGSAMLEKELFAAIDSKEQFAVCEIAVNYFVAFMNRYGEYAADELIRFTGAIIESMCEKHGFQDKIVYHIDQNRFVFVAPPEKAIAIVKDMINSFDSHVDLMFDPSDREKGYVLSKDQNGDIGSFPLACLIVAIATNRSIPLIHPLQIAHITNEILVYLSRRDYSCYMADRRKTDRTPYAARLSKQPSGQQGEQPEAGS